MYVVYIKDFVALWPQGRATDQDKRAGGTVAVYAVGDEDITQLIRKQFRYSVNIRSPNKWNSLKLGR